MTLDELKTGKAAAVVGISEDCPIRDRLGELGLTPGAHVRCLMNSPLGDPSAYLFRGAVTAIRKSGARFVRVNPL